MFDTAVLRRFSKIGALEPQGHVEALADAKMSNHEQTLKTLLALESDSVCYGFVAQSTGEIVAEAGEKELLPRTIVDVSLRPESIISRYEECERFGEVDPGMLPRGYAHDRVSAVIGIPSPDVLLVLFGMMPEAVAMAASDLSARVAWYWSHRRRVWSAVEAAYMSPELRAPTDSY